MKKEVQYKESADQYRDLCRGTTDGEGSWASCERFDFNIGKWVDDDTAWDVMTGQIKANRLTAQQVQQILKREGITPSQAKKATKENKTIKEKVKLGCGGCLIFCLALFVLLIIIGLLAGPSDSSTSGSSEADTEVSAEALAADDDQLNSTDQADSSDRTEDATTAESVEESAAEETSENVTEDATEAVAENATEGTSVVDEWPEVTALGLDNSTMLSIYEDYRAAIKANSGEYESRFDQEIGDKYGISGDDAYLVYSYARLNYDTLVSDSGTDISNIQLKFHTLLEATTNGGTLIIKAKIKPNQTTKMTLDGCYYGVYYAIQDYGLETFDELDYWAVADMTDGSESKVISFTIPKNIMQRVADESIVANKLANYAEDVWILPSLQRDMEK